MVGKGCVICPPFSTTLFLYPPDHQESHRLSPRLYCWSKESQEGIVYKVQGNAMSEVVSKFVLFQCVANPAI